MKITAGQLLVLSSGEYSHYSIDIVARALRDFDTDEEERRCREETVPRPRWRTIPLSLPQWAIKLPETVTEWNVT